MRRADRLFQLILLLGRRRSVTGESLAESLGVSRRTVYRDIRDLSLSGVPIQGEAGVGFRLKSGYQVPPLMLTAEEIQALVFGARLVKSCADEGLGAAADTLLAKVDAALPASQKHRLEDTGLIVPDFRVSVEVKRCLRDLRTAISALRILRFRYTGGDGVVIALRVRPLCLRYIGGTWTLGGWSESDSAFRVFRVYRIQNLEITTERFGYQAGCGVAEFLAAADRLGPGG
ncbi:MAG: YafY family transcriptional regulator [Betaproteobacteria bacterium]|nr:YafY family transcriptional regulator [Betaproteobacteria bacterium]